jgi:hypothetical protein
MATLRRICVVGPSLEPQVVTDVHPIPTWETISVGKCRQSLPSRVEIHKPRTDFSPYPSGIGVAVIPSIPQTVKGKGEELVNKCKFHPQPTLLGR